MAYCGISGGKNIPISFVSGTIEYILDVKQKSMETRTMLYKIASMGAMACALGFIVAFGFGHYRIAWAFVLVLILCAEARVQFKERLARTALFYVHLSAAIPFFIALTVLAFAFKSMWLEILTACLAAVVFATGTVLWHRGMQKQYSHPQET